VIFFIKTKAETAMEREEYELLDAAWHRGNDAGEGFAVGEAFDSTAEAIGRAGWDLLHTARDDGEISVARDDLLRLVGVGNANGPWGVILPSDDGGENA
jgi:hypothetical protein